MRRREFLERCAAATCAAMGASGVNGVLAAKEDPKGGAKKPAPPSGAAVRTVLGPIAPEKLGATLTHEHAPLVDWSELYELAAADVGPVKERMLKTSVEMLTAFHKSLGTKYGPGAIVECTPIRVGRYPQLLVELAKKLPVHVVGCTGFWCEAMAPQHPWALRLSLEKDGAKKIAQLYLREITEGMEDPAGRWGEKFTTVRAGIIKVATSSYLRPSERRCHEAAALASAETGCPITTHTTDGGGLEQAKLLISSGAKPDRIIIGHQGNKDDRASEEATLYHLELAKLGCYVQFDRVGHAAYPLDKCARQIARLVAAGHADQLLLAHDHVPFFYQNYAEAAGGPDGWKANAEDFTTVTTDLLKALSEAGVDESDQRKMLVTNPARVLAF